MHHLQGLLLLAGTTLCLGPAFALGAQSQAGGDRPGPVREAPRAAPVRSEPLRADDTAHPDGALNPRQAERWLEAAGHRPVPEGTEPEPAVGGFSLAPRRDRLHFDEERGVHWVRGRSFKASAGPDGFAFVPFLGARASRNWPVHFHLAAATVDGAPAALRRTAAVTREGDAFFLERGAVVAEYCVALDGVEQLFHVKSEGAQGEIVLLLDVETDLFGRAVDRTLRFEGPEGGATYGAAVAFDEAGRRVDVETRYEPGTIQLTVPADFVEDARGDITVDPVISTYFVDRAAEDQTEPDTAYDFQADAFFHVYEDEFSLVDVDVYMTGIDMGQNRVFEGYVNLSATSWIEPEVAGINGEDRLLVVATDATGGDQGIAGRLFRTGSLDFAGPSFEIADTGIPGLATWTNKRPDVGGNGSFSPGHRFLVTWEREFSSGERVARYCTVDASGNVGPTTALGPAASTSPFVTQVRVSESVGDPSTTNVWNVCFSNETPSDDRQLWTAQLNPDGSVAEAPWIAAASGSVRYAGLDVSDAIVVDGLDPTYLIVYDDFTTFNEDVVAVVCRGGTAHGVVDVNVREHAPRSLDQAAPKLATTADRFIVLYAERFGATWDAFVTVLDLVEGDQLAVAERRTYWTVGLEPGVSLASRWSGGLASRWVGMAGPWFGLEEDGMDIFAAVLSADTPSSPAFQYCSGTVNSRGDRGFLRLEGSRSRFTPKTAVAEAVPRDQFCLLLSGTWDAHVPGAGGSEGTLCLGGTLGRYNDQIVAANSMGVAEFTIDPTAIPAGGALYSAAAGDFYQWQVWHRDVVAAGTTSNFTNAVTIRFE